MARHNEIRPANERMSIGAANARMSYDAAQRGNWDARWMPQDESPDVELSRDLRRLRERTIDLVRNDPVAYGAIATIASNVVGRGPRPRSMAASSEIREKLDALWWAWTPRAGWDGISSWADQIRGVVHAACMSGDVGVLWPDVGDGTGPRIDLVDARRIDSPTDKTPDADSSRLGVGYDKYGRMQGIYIASGESAGGTRDNFRWFPLEKNGRINCRLYRRPSVMRPRQSRGVPMFASAALDLKDSREYRRTEVRRAQRAAKDVYIFTTPNPKEVADALENVRMQAQAEGLDADAVAESMLGRSYGTVPDGNTVIAALGETVTAVQQPPVNGGVGDYLKAMRRSIAGCTELPAEEVFCDYSGLNYSNARTIRTLSDAVYKRWQDSLEDAVCSPTWTLLVRYWWATGALGNIAWSDDLAAHEWSWDKIEWVDPAKEVGANAEAMETNQKSIVEICAERGRDWKQVLRENLQAEAEEAEMRREMGLPEKNAASAALPKATPVAKPEDDDDA